MADDVDVYTANEDGILQRRIAAVQAEVRAPGAYAVGACIDCDGDIPAARLAAYPNTRRCVDCQESFEAGASHPERKG